MVNKSYTQAQPPLEFIPPAFNPAVLQLSKLVLPLWLKYQTDIAKIEAKNTEIFIEHYNQFRAEKIRLMLAFRHPSPNDPACMAYFFWRLVPQLARKHKLSLNRPVHSHFIYDRGIPLWAGDAVGWLYSRLGGTPIMRGSLDRLGLKSARQLFVDGTFPIAAAPEGATNGHNEIISPLEPGIAQLSFWCAEDLQKQNREQKVIILPIAIKYSFLSPPWQALDHLLTQLESDCNLTNSTNKIKFQNLSNLDELEIKQLITTYYQRLYRLGEYLLKTMEEFYRNFYHQNIAEIDNAVPENLQLKTRLENLLDVALKVAETYFNIQPKGDVIARCRRLEQAGWDYIYRAELKENNLSNIDRGLADLVAQEASLRMWHMRIVESFVAVTGNYVKAKPSAERFAETAMILWDLVARIRGDNPWNRPRLEDQKVTISVGEPLSISERYPSYKKSRRQAVASLTQDLQTSLEKLIVSSE